MLVQLVLTGEGGELDRQTIAIHGQPYGYEDVADADVSSAIYQALHAWMLAPGDVIKIDEV